MKIYIRVVSIFGNNLSLSRLPYGVWRSRRRWRGWSCLVCI